MNVKPCNMAVLLKTLTLVYHGLSVPLDPPAVEDPARDAFETMMDARSRARNGAKELIGFLKTYDFHDAALHGIADTVGNAVLKDVVDEMRQHPLIQMIEQMTGVTLDDALDAPIEDGCTCGLRPIPGREAYGLERDEVNDAILTHLTAGDKIKAIKEYRAIHGCGLKESKDRIETIIWTYRGGTIDGGNNPPVFGPSRNWRP